MNYGDLLDRFLVCNNELVATTDDLSTAYRTPPTTGHKAADLPMIYALPAAFEVQGRDAGTDDDTDTVIMHILIAPLDADSVDTGNLSESINTAETLADAARDYYRNHRKLNASIIDPPAEPVPVSNLAGLWRGVDFSGRIVVGLQGYDGDRYYGVELTFRVYSTEDVEQLP